MQTMKLRTALLFSCLLFVPAMSLAQNTLPPDVQAKVDAAVADVLAKTGVPSASVGIVQNGAIVMTKAYGLAKLDPKTPATAEMRYAVGSISKQFTAACILLLQEDGKLTIDDPVSKWFPELTRSKDVKIRHLLSHTSGYQDYAPQDYTIPAWTKPTTADRIIHEWATKPLDFEPGSQYQYSNTNFNIAGLIVEKASGQPFWTFLSSRVLKPLGMAATIDLDQERPKMEPIGYKRHALAPLRPAIPEAPGWYFADGEMAMPVGDLLRWDLSMMNQTVLKKDSYAAMWTDQKLTTGNSARYGLGVSVGMNAGRRVVSHSGEVGGFVAQNVILPDDKFAVAVLTNQDASAAAGSIGRAVMNLLAPAPAAPVAAPTTEKEKAEAQAKDIIVKLQQGQIDRTLFTGNGNFYFDPASLEDHRTSLSPLGAVQSVTQTTTNLRGGMTFRSFDVAFANGTHVRLTTYTTNDGKLEQFLIAAQG